MPEISIPPDVVPGFESISRLTKTLPSELKHIASSIEKSKHLIDLKDDWDDEGSLATNIETYIKSVKFIVDYSIYIFENMDRIIIDTPDISLLKDGSIIVNWESENGSFAIIFDKKPNDIAYYYAKSKTNNQIPLKYGINVNKDIDKTTTAQWMSDHLQLKKGESLPLKDRVYRFGLEELKEKEEDRFIPKLRFFDLHPMDLYKLSVDWEAKTTPEEVIIRVGCSYKPNTVVFKNHKTRVIYALTIDFLVSLDEIIGVNYDPIIHAKPKKGLPDNIAHSIIVFDKDKYDDPQNRAAILIELRDHAKDKKVHFNMKAVDEAVMKYRSL